MQTLDLVRVAAEAERLRWQRRARRMAMCVALGAIAAGFAAAAVAILHVVGYLALRPQFSALGSAAILLGADIVLAAIFGFLASRGGPDAVEREAIEVRQKAIAQIGRTLAFMSMVRMVARLVRKR